ncbi:MAG TPA: protein kinase [Kofleriaceae bacterium]|nr:protein kinase [Kofleriaceae bacterium]
MIGRELGRGVTGTVYVAEDAMLARPVAIKFAADLDAGARQRFLLEARAVAQIHHPNVVGIYRVGTLDGRPYFVTELIRGTSLAEVARPMPWQAALGIAIGVARGLAAAHRRNIVHCDLKPSNVMIDDGGLAKIIDFGMARIAIEGATGAGIPVGTPDYMAPEVWQGEAPTRRADVYSLGAVLFELLTGAPPFGEVPPAALRQRVTTSDAPAVRDRAPDVDPGLAQIVARCLRRERKARFADADELREALERLHASRRAAVRTGENPYRGLLPFEASHRGVFFGRRSEIDAVVARLRGEPIVLVTGDSGVGKSSLCRAGVVPAVVDGELGGPWRAITMVPGPRPLTALATALGEPGLVAQVREAPAVLVRELRRHAGDHGLIVFIDQLEELITLGDPGEVAALDEGIAALIEGVPGLRLLATVRADFLARISTLPGLGRDLSRLLYFLRPLPPERLRDVIVGPAAAVGGRFESDAIVDDLIESTAKAGSGGLPLLSFALADLWEARDREQGMISSASVTAMGGVAGALSRHADVVIGGMLPPERAEARRVLLRLVTAMGTRARCAAHVVASSDSARAALDALVSGRLVVARDVEPEPVYELAHECLLTGWTTLRHWIEADSAGRATRERLTAAAVEWVQRDRPGDLTWQGKRLREALLLDTESLSEEERELVSASLRAARRRRWQRWFAGLGAIALVVLAFATQRYLARRELAAQVAEVLADAHTTLDKARVARSRWGELASKAFKEFDAARQDAGEAIWREALAQRGRVERAYREASGLVEIALAKDPNRADVRDLTGDILLERATLAEQLHDLNQRDELIARLELYDADGTRRAEWDAPGRVRVRTLPGAEIKIEPTRQRATGSLDVPLPPRGYVVTIAAPGHVDVRAPILVERGRAIDLEITPPRSEDVPPGFVYVPAGEFLFGNANEDDRTTFFQTTPLRRRTTGEFLIARNEVTFADWLTYLETLPAVERNARLPGTATKISGSLELARDRAGHWGFALSVGKHGYAASWGQPIVYPHYQGGKPQDWRKFPVLAVSGDDAEAYAAWLDRTERVPGARLCSEVEWERAARGADGRGYPAGRPLEPQEANIDATHGEGEMGPDEVGSHLASMSPFGVLDMAGNAFEIAKAEGGGYILRGGSYYQDRKTAHLTNRAAATSTLRDAGVGFRVCASPHYPSESPPLPPEVPTMRDIRPKCGACREQTSWSLRVFLVVASAVAS